MSSQATITPRPMSNTRQLGRPLPVPSISDRSATFGRHRAWIPQPRDDRDHQQSECHAEGRYHEYQRRPTAARFAPHHTA